MTKLYHRMKNFENVSDPAKEAAELQGYIKALLESGSCTYEDAYNLMKCLNGCIIALV